MYKNTNCKFPYQIVLLLLSGIQLLPSVECHAAVNFQDWIQDTMRSGVGQGLAGMGMKALSDFRGGLQGLLPTSPSSEKTVGNKGNSVNGSPTVKYKSGASLPVDIDADPLRNIEPVALHSTCSNSQLKSYSPGLFGFNFDPFRRENAHTGIQSGGECVALSNCSSLISNIPVSTRDSDFCALEDKDGSIGVCCIHNFNKRMSNYSGSSHMQAKIMDGLLKVNTVIPPADIGPNYSSALLKSTHAAIDNIKTLSQLRKKYILSGNFVRNGTQFIYPPHPEAQPISEGGIGLVQTTRSLTLNLGLGNQLKTTGDQVKPISVLKMKTGQVFCPASTPPECPESSKRYRTFDGSCNNLLDKKIGQTFTPLTRLTISAYDDGVFSPRGSSNASHTLPTARLVSSVVTAGKRIPSPMFTYAFAQAGQFISHDMSHVPVYDLGNHLAIKCCTDEGQYLPQQDLHPLCFPIDVPETDNFFSVYGVRCMPLIRSMISSTKCTVGSAQQMNQVTHWMDLSTVYGSTIETQHNLRAFTGGRLKVLNHRGIQYLTLYPPCHKPYDADNCQFSTGDIRGNHQIYLTVFHTVWYREHNRIANILHTFHPEWEDEIIYQEARRITIAEYQHINYNEVIPLYVGRSMAEKFDIIPNVFYFTKFNENIDGSVANEHTAAAFRLGHSMVEDYVKIISKNKIAENLTIHGTLERSVYLFSNGAFDGSIRGLTRMSAKNRDQWVTSELRNRLFQPINKPYGFDLAAINIQRGRDHGLPSYSTVVNFLSKYCSLPKINNFDDMTKLIPKPVVENFKKLYKSYDDVDLWIGGLAENSIADGVAGPTFACIIADQFARSKFGDRFYYEHSDLPNSFNAAQLHAIRSSSAARIFCDNGDNIDLIQPLVFRKITATNPLVSCSNSLTIPVVDLSLWI